MPQRILSFFSFLFLCSSYCSAQYEKERMTWYFGYSKGVDFHTSLPVVLSDGAMQGAEGCSVANDSAGYLLFYSNGESIWDRDHNIMSNGDSLSGHASAVQSVLIVKKPGSNNLYYVFTNDAEENKGKNGFRYSIVDMSLNGGYGDVTVKNRLVFAPGSEKMAACQHRNNKDFWIVSQARGGNIYRSYLLTAAGVDTGYYVLNTFAYDSIYKGFDPGELKFSFDRKKIAAAHTGLCGTQVFDFDDLTGKMSNAFTIDRSWSKKNVYGLTFSPNSRFLYLACWSPKITWQFDIQAGDSNAIRLSAQKLAISGGSMQVATDGKIYLRSGEYLSVIPYPDLPYPSCGSVENAVNIGPGASSLGLPNFPVIHKEAYHCTEAVVSNVFTPNDDSFNDTFKPDVCEYAVNYRLTIYNRWGQMVFETGSMEEAWDGTFHGENVAEGAYFWLISYSMFNEAHKTSGSLTLLR